MIRLATGMVRARFILPGLYLALALCVWIDFALTNHDGLANIWLFAVTLPVTLVGLVFGSLVGEPSFSFMPTGFGYLTNHAFYYIPAVALTALLPWWIGRAIDRRLS